MKHSITYLIIIALLTLYSIPAFASLDINTDPLFFNTTDYQTLTGTIEVINNGNETVNLVFSSDNNLNLTLPGESNLNVNETKNFGFLLILELFKEPGTYEGQISVENSNDSSDNATISLTALVNERKELIVTEKLGLVLMPGTSKNRDFTITNNGNVDLTDITISSTNNNSLITETFSDVPDLEPGDSASVNWEVEIDDSIEYDDYSWEIEVESGVLSKEIDVDLEVKFSYCDLGDIGGKLEITLDGPDSSDDFKIGEEAEGEVTVKNDWHDELDVVIKALLYNTDKNKKVEEIKIESFSLDEDDEDSIDFEIELESSKIDPDDDYRLYVKIYEKNNEENECNEDSGRFYLDVEKHEVIITDFEFTPSIIDCGDLVYLEFEILNIGKSDEKDVTVEIMNKELKIDEKSEEFDLEKSGDDESDYNVRFINQIPEELLSGEYFIKTRVFYNDDEDMYTENYVINLNRCKAGLRRPGITTLATADGGITMEVISTTVKTKPGKTFVVPISIKNNGALKTEVDVEITNAEGVGVPGSKKILTLLPGHSTILYLDIVANSDLEEGKRSLTVNVMSNGELIASNTVTVDVIGEGEESEAEAEDKKPLGEKLKDVEALKGGFWFFGDLILILIAVFLVRSIFRKD